MNADNGLSIDPRDALHQLMRKYAGQHVHFFPKWGNCGDGFISYATYKIFEAYDISFTAHRQSDVVHDSIVFIGGGGNLIEGVYTHVADLIRAHRNDNKIVLLPHTIVGYADVLAETANNLEVLCRDRKSYDLARANAAKPENVALAHDMTFYLSDDHFREFFLPGAGLLSALRVDTESAAQFEVPDDNIDISRCWDGDIWTSPKFAEYATKSLFAFVAQYETIITDRLHVSIIGSFLRKRVVLMPNSYFKNSAVFEHSMQERFPLTRFGDTTENVELVASYGTTLALRTDDDPPVGEAPAGHGAKGIRAILANIFK